MHLARAWAALLVTSSLACSSPRNDGPSTAADASLDDPHVVSTATETLAILHAHEPFAAALADARAFHREGESFSLVGTRLDVRAPKLASSALRLAAHDRANAWIEIVPLDVRDAEAHVDEGALVYRDALEGRRGDLTLIGGGAGIEELRVLHAVGDDPTYRARYRVRLGPGIATVRAREGRIECVDATGYVQIGTAPMFAIDARGEKRALDARISSMGAEVATEYTIELTVSLAGLTAPIVVDPVWTTLAPMSSSRFGFGATTLKDGTILAAGGQSAGAGLSTAEIYDPTKNTWTTTGSMNRAHGGDTILTMSSGKVLYISGTATYDSFGETYDPATKKWTTIAFPLATGWDYGFLYQISAGKVLYFDVNATVHLYDEATATWSVGAPNPKARYQVGAARLTDGRILVAGGQDVPGKSYAQTDIYDPTKDSWTTVGPLSTRRVRPTVMPLPGGRAIAFAGATAGGADTTLTEVFDPGTGTWSTVAPLPLSYSGSGGFKAGALIDGGRVFTTGIGVGNQSAIFDPTLNDWRIVSPMAEPHGYPTLQANAGGVLVFGGFATSTYSTTVERYTALASGAACNGATPGDCRSGACADGVCCDRACTGACERCDAAGKIGTCTAMTGAPHDGRSCAPYGTCTAGACTGGCTVDGDCDGASWCSGGKCVAKSANGSTCTATRTCASGSCVDGVCCDVACTGQCEACNLGGREGVCSPVTGTPTGGRAACSDGGKECGAVCNGTRRDACAYLAPGTTPCGTGACAGGIETHASTCDGKGACSDVPTSCRAYACGVGACKTACGTKLDCSPGNICVANACVPAPGLGDACKDAAECSTEHCTDGVCCGVASCGVGSTCAAPGKTGHCSKQLGIACTIADECASGKCIDGVCCESDCTGTCEACSVAGSLGKCTAVKGKPRGARPACPSDATNVCAAMLCDGVDHGKCTAFVGPEVSCRARACKDGTLVEEAACEAKGACPASSPKSCGGYACNSTGTECLTLCHADPECAKGFSCRKGECRPVAAECSADGRSQIAIDGTATPCGDFLCRGDRCVTACTSADDCAPGKACNPDGSCGEPTVSEGSSGCSVGSGATSQGSGVSFGALAMLGVSMVALRRRRRAMARTVLSIATCAIAACDAREARESEPIDGGAQVTPTLAAHDASPVAAIDRSHDARDVLETLGAFGAFGARVRMAPPLDRMRDGFRQRPTIGAFHPLGAPLLATLPKSAAGTVHLELAGHPELSLDVIARDIDDAPAEMASAGSPSGAIVYRHVDATMDLVHVVDAQGTEELRLLHDARPTTLRYTLRLGAGFSSARLVDGRVEVVDHAGASRIHAAKIVALDAKGTKRALSVSLSHEADTYTLTATLDAEGLTAPIAIDPAWSSLAESGYPHSRAYVVAMAGGEYMIAADESNDRREKFTASTSTFSDANWISSHTGGWASQLPSGKVIVGGGLDAPYSRPTDIYDPIARTWSSGPLRTLSRGTSTTVYLPAPYNQPLITGGNTSSSCEAVVERYTESSASFSVVAPMSVGRCGHTATVLSSGKVLVTGGSLDYTLSYSSAEIYDPATNAWKAAAPMSRIRQAHSAIKLPSGRVLVVGNNTYFTPPSADTAEVYDPTTDKWTSTSPMRVKRYLAFLALLPSGRVLVAGGTSEDAGAEVYDPVTNSFISAGPMSVAREQPSGIALGDGSVVVFGGIFKGESLFSADRFVEQPIGAACPGDGACTSGHCVDGVCCSSACSGACQVCDASGSKGTCSSITGVPHTGHPSCAPYVACVSGACAAACASDGDCATTSFCAGGACVAKKANGASCLAARECGSAACADGVCCNVACTGQCEACAESGSVGTCVAVTGLPRSTHAPCDGIAVGGSCGTHCDGVQRKACVYPPAAVTKCAVDACSGGVETHASSCDGVGRCNDAPKHCGAYACNATRCNTTCAATKDCAAGFVCKATACIPAPGLGQACSASAPCEGALFCTDGVCCGAASCASGKSCALPATKGTCAAVDGQSCASDGECGSGTCADGYCCDTTCNGQCQACDVAGNIGKCVAIKGAPHGKRIACAASTSSPCESTVCDGSDGSRCLAFVGGELSCRAASCSDGVATAADTCSAGTCPTPKTTRCAPYRCNEGKSACATSCTKGEECAAGFVCNKGVCVAAKRQCSADGVSVIDPEGNAYSCGAYVCRGDDCLDTCTSSDDCSVGTACDGAGRCSTPAPPTTDDGGTSGCALSGGSSGSNGALASLLLAALTLAAARRRKR